MRRIILGLFAALAFAGCALAQPGPAPGSGTVTSVAVSGGTTGLTTSGGPVTTTGTITLAGTLAAANGGTGLAAFPVPNYISGLNLSTAGGSGTFGISAGVAADSTNAALMALASAFTKTTSAWVVGTGNGCLDTGSIANNTWYTIYVIERTDTQVVDVECSTNSTSPSLPTSYTLYRRIGAMKTDGSAHWTAFFQIGNQFVWTAPILDMSAITGSTTPALEALSVPPGVAVLAQGNALQVNSTGGAADMLFYSPNAGTQAASTPAGNVSLYTPNSGAAAGQFSILTNTSNQIYLVASATSASITTYWVTTGWIDYRGQQ